MGQQIPCRGGGDCSTSCTCPKTLQGSVGDKRIRPSRVCQPQVQTHPKLTNAAWATDFTHWSPQRPTILVERLEQSVEQMFLPASKEDLYRLPPPSFHKERSQSIIYSQRTGEKSEIKEVSSLSMTPTPPKRGLRNQLCSCREEEHVSKPRARATNGTKDSKPPRDRRD